MPDERPGPSGAVPATREELERLRPPGAVHRIARRLEAAGYETWCVGGAVRDALLGIAHLDWDLATSAPPGEIRRLFRRTVPVGIEFGTVGVLDEQGHMHEVTTFRRDVRTDGRHAEVEFGVSLEDDLARRDFTINAIAYSPSRRAVFDPFGGRADLRAGVLRAVGDPAQRMVEDRLRALRALRFAARFGFRIDEPTWAAICESAPHLGRLSPERVKQELEKTMEQVACPSRALRWWRESGAFTTLIPALATVPDETLAAVDVPARAVGPRSHARRLLRLAVLFSDLAPEEARSVLRALRFSNADVRAIAGLVELWSAMGEEMRARLVSGPPLTDAEIRRWVARTGRLRVAPLVRLAHARWTADRAAGRPDVPDAPAVRSVYRRAVRIAFRDPVEIGDLAIGGDELRAVGIPPGPHMAELLRALLEYVVEDPARNTVDHLLARARALAEERA